MKRKITSLSIIALLTIMGGTLIVKQVTVRKQIGLPEGYEEPSGRVEKLKIERNVSKFYDENLDLVAFGPGSGWLKIKTRDGISPTISFNSVCQRDIQKFNSYSKSLGLPLRVAFSDNVLRLSSIEKSNDPSQLADITAEKIGENSIMNKGFFQKDAQPLLAIRKDPSGRVKLVAVDKPEEKPGVVPGESDVVIAKTNGNSEQDQKTLINN